MANYGGFVTYSANGMQRSPYVSKPYRAPRVVNYGTRSYRTGTNPYTARGRAYTPYTRRARRVYVPGGPSRPGGFTAGRAVIHAEKKFVDSGAGVDTALVAASTGAIVGGLVTTAQTADITGRTGRQVTGKYLYIRWSLNRTQALDVPTNGGIIRFMIVLDKSPNGGGVPAIGAILNSVDPHSMLLLDNRNRFSVLKDLVIETAFINIGTVASNSYMVHEGALGQSCGEWFIRLKDLIVTYNTTTATDAAISANNIYIVVIGEQAAANSYSYIYEARFRFTDD